MNSNVPLTAPTSDPIPPLGRLEATVREPVGSVSDARVTTTTTTANSSHSSRASVAFPANLARPVPRPPMRTEMAHRDPQIPYGAGHEDEPGSAEGFGGEPHTAADGSLDDERPFALLNFLPSTTTSVVTTTTTLTTHFAPLKIPKSSQSAAGFAGLTTLIDREGQRRGGGGGGGGAGRQDESNARAYPLSETDWTATGLGTFKLEVGELTARFQHEAPRLAPAPTPKPSGSGTTDMQNKGKGNGVHGGSVKGKGKETQSDRDQYDLTGGTDDGTDPERGGGKERRSSMARASPGPPPRKRRRSYANQGDRGHVLLPSPNQSPHSPVPTSARDDDDREMISAAIEPDVPRLAGAAIPAPQSFDLGQTPAISALLSLPDLVDTFDQLSPALQSYLIFNLLRRSSIPVLQTVANIIAPALRRDFLSDLPPELSVQILGYLDPTTLCRASLVCKRWRRLVDGEWRIWKEMMDQDGLWIGDGSEEREAREIVTGRKENWFLERWKAGVWDDKKTSTWNGKVDPDSFYVDNVLQRLPRRPSISASSVQPASPTDSREPSPSAALGTEGESHSVHPYKILYRRRWLTRRNWKHSEPKRTTFTSSTATTNVVTCLQFDEEKIVSASDDADHSIHVFDTQSGSERAELRGHEGGVWALQYIGNVLVSGSTDRSVRVWDLDSAKCTHEFLGHTSTVRCLQIVEPINVNPDADGEPVWEPPYPLVVTGSRDWSLRVWKLPFAGRDREYHPAVPMSPTEGNNEPIDNPYYERQLAGHRHAVRAVAAAGRTVVSGSYDHNVRVWDLLTGECRHVLEGHSQKVYSVVLDYHRRQCASGSMDGTVRLWSTETGEQLHSLDGHSSLVGLLGLSRRCLVSAAADWTLRIWNPETGECRHALNAHQGAITCFQHDEYKIVSGSDGTLKMWDTQTGEFVRDLLANLTGVWQVAFNQRYCIAAVQRQGSSEFELLDFGSVSEDEIKPNRDGHTLATTTTTTTRSPPTPPNLDAAIPPARTRTDDDDTDMNDYPARGPSRELVHAASSSSSSSPSSSARPTTDRDPPSNIPAGGSTAVTTPNNNGAEHSSSSRLGPGGGLAAGALRRIDSTRNLAEHTAFSSPRGPTTIDSPTVQGRGRGGGGGGGSAASMDVDEDEVEARVRPPAAETTTCGERESSTSA